MMLKNLMEEKPLDFNQPLLSVRRFTATVASSEADDRRKTDKPLPKLPPLPAYKSELKSGPLRNPGSVPFLWEQIPGRPKDESKSQYKALEWTPTAPKLPPGRVSNNKKQALGKGHKGTTAAQSRRTRTGNILNNSQKVLTLDRKQVTKYESCKEDMEDKGITVSEDGDETYLDALDALSRTESSYMNCSVSGLSGLDGSDIKPSGTFSTDPQMRDFMMGRFLPAAKAMASETPQYATRKQPVAREQPSSQEKPRVVKKVVSGDKRHPLNQYRPNFFPRYVQDIAGEESKDEGDDYEGSENALAKVCGLFPGFCLKNSFCLMNPVPGMRMQAQLPISSVSRVHAKSSYASPHSEAKTVNAGGVGYEQRLVNGHQEAGLHEDKIDLKRESNQTSNQSDYQNGSSAYRRLQGSGISPYRNECLQSSLHKEKGFLGVHVPEKAKNSRETSSSDPYRKGQKIFWELVATENAECEVGSGSPVVEKTLYIDSVHTVKSPNSNSCSTDIKGLADYRGNDFEIPEKRSEMEETPSVEFSVQDIEHLAVENETAIVPPKCLDFADSSFLSCSGKSTNDVQTDGKNGSTQEQDLIQDSSKLLSSKVADQEKINLERQRLEKSAGLKISHGLTQDCITLTSLKPADEKKIDLESQQCRTSGTEESSHGLGQNAITLSSSKVVNKGKIDLKSQQLMKFGNQESSQGYNPRLPLGPPLPKSPSESWLKRTLPTISSRNSSSQSSLGSRIYTSSQASKKSSLDPKWETIVKTSNTHHGHLRFSEELLTPIPEA